MTGKHRSRRCSELVGDLVGAGVVVDLAGVGVEAAVVEPAAPSAADHDQGAIAHVHVTE